MLSSDSCRGDVSFYPTVEDNYQSLSGVLRCLSHYHGWIVNILRVHAEILILALDHRHNFQYVIGRLLLIYFNGVTFSSYMSSLCGSWHRQTIINKTDGREYHANWHTKRTVNQWNPCCSNAKTVEQLLKLGFTVAVERRGSTGKFWR